MKVPSFFIIFCKAVAPKISLSRNLEGKGPRIIPRILVQFISSPKQTSMFFWGCQEMIHKPISIDPDQNLKVLKYTSGSSLSSPRSFMALALADPFEKRKTKLFLDFRKLPALMLGKY